MSPASDYKTLDLQVFEPGDLILWNRLDVSTLLLKPLPQLAMILNVRNVATLDVWYVTENKISVITRTDLYRWLSERDVNPKIVRNEEVIWPKK